jgi:hypothetical protein
MCDPAMPPDRATRETQNVDRRWLLAAIAVFGASAAVLLVASWVYRATGPHPEITLLVRRVKALARRLLPRIRRSPGG